MKYLLIIFLLITATASAEVLIGSKAKISNAMFQGVGGVVETNNIISSSGNDIVSSGGNNLVP